MSDASTEAAPPSPRTGTVLVVDDESAVVDLYERMLGPHHDVRTATGGEEALEKLRPDVDVVLLDRRMPDLTGGEVLETLRSNGHDCAVAMITAVRPETDILSMDFDAYRVKPISSEELNDLVDELLLRSRYSTDLREMLAITEKLAALESAHDRAHLRAHEEYEQLAARYQDLLSETEHHFAEIADRTDLRMVYRDILED